MITNRDQLIDALANNSTRIVIDKASIANAAAAISRMPPAASSRKNSPKAWRARARIVVGSFIAPV